MAGYSSELQKKIAQWYLAMIETLLSRPRGIRTGYLQKSSAILLITSIVLGVALAVIWAWLNDWPGPIKASDINQTRANTNLPPPGESIQLRQTFIPKQDGLYELELIVVRLSESSKTGELTFQLIDSTGLTVSSHTIKTESLTHNQTIRLNFAPQRQSAGEEYTLLIGGKGDNDASVWAYDLDVYSGGELTTIGAETTAQDLRFVSRYQLSLETALKQLRRMLMDDALFLVLALSFIVVPGFLLLLVSERWLPRIDTGAWLGLALTLGISAWPFLWIGMTLVGGQFRPRMLWLLFGLGWLGIIFLFWRRRRDRPIPNRFSNLSWHHAALLILLLIGLAVRLLAVRELVLPPWVDSSRHALITTIMAQNGQTISDFGPYLEVDRFPYHFGYHTIAASLAQMFSLDVPGQQLVLGQLLNALFPLAIYTATYLMTRRKNAALLAAFLLALPFFFPGYYVTWGRMTQLTGLLVMAIAVALVWLITRGARGWRRVWWLVAILAAAIFIIHFRVFLLFVIFSTVVFIYSRGRGWRRLLLAAAASFFLVLPRLVALWRDVGGSNIGSAIPGFNAFPQGYITVGWERYFLFMGAIAVLLAFLALLKQKKWGWLPLILATWAAVVALFLEGERLGLPQTSLINLNSAYISAFLPLAIILAVVLDRVIGWLFSLSGSLKPLPVAGLAALLTLTVLFGITQQVGIINPVTVLAFEEDLDGLAWLDKNTPDTSKVAVNSWRWLGSTWAGGDGGAWIVPLTGRSSTTPPVDYIYGRPLANQVNAFNEQASMVEDWSKLEASAWLGENEIDYIYVGTRGGYFDPSDLAKNPALKQVYHQGGVFIFALELES